MDKIDPLSIGATTNNFGSGSGKMLWLRFFRLDHTVCQNNFILVLSSVVDPNPK
jgi:hypothetical protein